MHVRAVTRWPARGLPLLFAGLVFTGCREPLNSPYPNEDPGQSTINIFYTEEPNHMDPARSYHFLRSGNILEAPFEYHFLKRPYELIPATATAIPQREQRRVRHGNREVTAFVYTIQLKEGIRYHDHPCFVEANHHLTKAQVKNLKHASKLPERGTRELVAADYVHAIRRLADPRLACPIYNLLGKNLLGMDDYRLMLEETLSRKRAARRAVAGMLYNQETDEKYAPIQIDYGDGADPFPFVQETGRYTFEITLSREYPQLLYWMALPFFAPVPPEATAFYSQRLLLERNFSFDRDFVGTGAFFLETLDPVNQIVLARNPNFRDQRYPHLDPPNPDDVAAVANYERCRQAGMLVDTGKRLPLVDRVIFRMDKEAIPRWNKFLQGYYDDCAVQPELFDETISLSSQGDATLTDDLSRRNVRMHVAQSATFSQYVFNMEDEVLGGFDEKRRKLRQAICMAFDNQEFIDILMNGLGILAQSPIPPGIFGQPPGETGINPFVYTWDSDLQRPAKRSDDEARKLLAEAGYPNGYGPDGKQLVIRFCTICATPAQRTTATFIKRQFEKLNIRMELDAVTGNRLNEKLLTGNFQMARTGWSADYPDPENFLFLFYTSDPDNPLTYNAARYCSAEFNRLYPDMQRLPNSPERMAVIQRMVDILREDAPGIFATHGMGYSLFHDWYRNVYPDPIVISPLKYVRLDGKKREEYRRKHNRPKIAPLAIIFAILFLASISALRSGLRHSREV